MKTKSSKESYSNLKYALSVVFLFFSIALQAQIDEDEEAEEAARDTIKGYNTGKVEIGNPRSIVDAYTYNPVTNRYVYTEKFEGFNVTYPLILTPEQYEELVLRESMREYYQENQER